MKRIEPEIHLEYFPACLFADELNEGVTEAGKKFPPVQFGDTRRRRRAVVSHSSQLLAMHECGIV